MALVLAVLVVVAVGIVSLALVVSAIRQNRDDDWLAEQRASVADFGARRAKARREAATDSSLAGDVTPEEARVDGYHFNLFI